MFSKLQDELFFGWVVVAAAFCVALVAYGVQYSFGIFLKPLSGDFGWSRVLVSGAVSLFMFSRGALAILTGWATDKYGPTKTVAVGGFFLGLGLILTSQINSAWQLYLFYGLMVGFGLSIAFAPLVATASRWFVSKRGLAIGVVTAGIGMGTVVMSPLARYLISVYEWQLSYVIIGLMAWVIVIPAALFLRRSPEEKGLLPQGGRYMDVLSIRCGLWVCLCRLCPPTPGNSWEALQAAVNRRNNWSSNVRGSYWRGNWSGSSPGYVFDITGTYFLAFLVSGICFIIALLLLAFIRVPEDAG